MGALGMHVAVTQEQLAHLTSLKGDHEKAWYLDDLDKSLDRELVQDTESAWDAIHRCLSDFPAGVQWFYAVDPEQGAYALPEDHGSAPLKLCILGGKRLSDDDRDYFIRLIEPHEVEELAQALAPIDEAWMRAKYFEHCRGAWPEFGEDDFQYTMGLFEPLCDFFTRVAGTGRAVIFIVDQ